ncbi:MAG: hypothetical protein ABL994_18475 [Verrucomicrobiales bacterium]
MNREPINPDDPQMSAYALGELSVAEAAEFEARLQDSPLARAELASMREIMGLLSMGLREEWKDGASHPKLTLLEPFTTVNSTVVVGEFRPVRHRLVSAAAVAAVLAVGSLVAFNQISRPEVSPVAVAVAPESVSVNGSGLLPASTVTAAHVPQLFLAEEVDDVAALDLAIDSGDLGTRIDPSYLDANQVIPASFSPGGAQVRTNSPERGQEFDRVDSYLPPLIGIASGRGVTTGMIESRLGKDRLRNNAAPRGNDSVLVSGYVTMGGGNFASESIETGVHGFRPVSISANPVADDDRGLQILADLNGLETELSELVEQFPEDSAKKADLERILVKSRKVVSQLQAELSR